MPIGWQVRAEQAGVITEVFGAEGDNVDVGSPFFVIDTSATGGRISWDYFVGVMIDLPGGAAAAAPAAAPTPVSAPTPAPKAAPKAASPAASAAAPSGVNL